MFNVMRQMRILDDVSETFSIFRESRLIKDGKIFKPSLALVHKRQILKQQSAFG